MYIYNFIIHGKNHKYEKFFVRVLEGGIFTRRGSRLSFNVVVQAGIDRPAQGNELAVIGLSPVVPPRLLAAPEVALPLSSSPLLQQQLRTDSQLLSTGN